MKKIVALVLALMVVMGLFSAYAAEDKIVIAGIYKAGDQQWFIGEGEAAKATVLEMGGDEFQYIDAKMNAEEYLRALDNAIASEVSGIIVCIPDQNLSAVTVEKCNEANIPVIAADDQLLDEKGELLAPFVGIDAYAIGKATGEWMVDYYKTEGLTAEDTAVLFLTADTIASCVPRTEGANEVWTANITDVPVYRADYKGSIEEGNQVAAATIVAHPEVNNWIVMAINDEGALGATRALEEATLDATSAVIGIGGYEAKNEFKKDYSCFKATAFINYVDVGAISAKNLMNFVVNGTEMPMDERTPAVVVTKDNYVDIMKDQAE